MPIRPPPAPLVRDAFLLLGALLSLGAAAQAQEPPARPPGIAPAPPPIACPEGMIAGKVPLKDGPEYAGLGAARKPVPIDGCVPKVPPKPAPAAVPPAAPASAPAPRPVPPR